MSPRRIVGNPSSAIHKWVYPKSGSSPNYGKFERTATASNDGRRYPTNVLYAPAVTSGIHPTQKPLDLCEYFIKTYTDEGAVVAVICAGSGTTAVAALNTGRRFICFENAPAIYCAAAERIGKAQEAVGEGQRGVDCFLKILFTANLLLNFTAERYILLAKELIDMPNIRPISDLRNYTMVLHDVAVGAPVFLTKNGRGRYAIIDIQDYEKMQATLRLMNELEKGRRSGEREGWLSPDDTRAHFRTRANEE